MNGRQKLKGSLALLLLASGLVTGVPSTGNAAFPGANGRIFYHRDLTPTSPGTTEIYSIKPDGTGATRLTNNDLPEYNPSASADGKWILFEREVMSDYEIFRMKPDGSRVRNLTKTQGEFLDDRDPGWSPNATRIVFMSNRDAMNAIYKMPVNDEDPTQISTPDSGAYDSSPRWSPNSEWIAFDRYVVGPDITLVCVVRPNGSDEDCVTDTSEIAHAQNPDWSPDSKRIVFEGDESPGGEPNIYVMKPDGSNLVQLTSTDQNNGNPAFSPNGEKIVFERGEDPARLMIVNVDGFGLHPLTPMAKDAEAADWSVKP